MGGWWTRGRTVGRGSMGTVSVAVSESSGEVFAVKSAEMSRSESLQREQRILSTISSPHIVEYMGWEVTSEGTELVYNLFMEYCPSGTLRDAIDLRGGRLGEPEIARYTQQIMNGLYYLHSGGIVHCDVKPRNILIAEDGAKISDFGCAKRVDDPACAIGGTPMFMAPEVARREDQGQSADVWALGCTVVEMATGKAPWSGSADPFSVMYRIAYSGESPDIPSCLSDEAKDFLSNCLTRDPNERWTVAQLLKHPFLAQLDSHVPKQSEDLKSGSPTSVLDHGLWSPSSEGSAHDSIHSDHTITANSAADRIRLLSSSSGWPCWTWEEDWVPVRGNSDETLCQSEVGPMDRSTTGLPETAVISTELFEHQDRNFRSCYSCKYFLRKCGWREGGDVISNDSSETQRINLVTSITNTL